MKTFELSKEIIQEIGQLISSKKNKDIKKIVDEIHYADLAEIINDLEFEQRIYLIKLIDSDKTSDVLTEVDEDVRDKILETLSVKEIAGEINELDSDDAVDILSDLTDEKQEKVISFIKDESKTEFLASKDNWFRPVQMEVGPDGAMYIADMYREVIEHPWSLPHGIKKHINLDSGNDRGRIYRIVPKEFIQQKLPRLNQVPVGDLVKLLEHSNAWHRSTAARLLFEKRDLIVIQPLRHLVNHGKTAYGRMHALHVLAAMDALAETDLNRAYRDESPTVRKEAIRLTETYFSSNQFCFKKPCVFAGMTKLQVRLEKSVQYPV